MQIVSKIQDYLMILASLAQIKI